MACDMVLHVLHVLHVRLASSCHVLWDCLASHSVFVFGLPFEDSFDQNVCNMDVGRV